MNIAEFLKSENIFEFASLSTECVKVVNLRRYERILEKFTPKTVVLFLMPYYTPESDLNISRYAVVRDYHYFVKELCERAKKALDCEFELCADTSPINEVEACVSAGLGVVGRNSLLINRRYGSWVFIGEFYFPLDKSDPFFNGIEKREVGTKTCIDCGRCVSLCKSIRDGDRSSCISFINQKKKIDKSEEKLIFDSGYIWGCDECQKVCIMNKSQNTPIEFFRENRIPRLDKEILSNLIETGEFSRRAYSWRGEKVIERNIEIFDKNK